MRSPEVARLLSIEWESASLGGDAAYGAATLPFESLAAIDEGFFSEEPETPRPVFIYVAGEAADPVALEEFEKKLFGDDDLALASRIFRFKRLPVNELSSSQRAEYAPKLPAFVVLDGKGRVAAKGHGTVPSKALVTLLAKGYGAQYQGTLSAQIGHLRAHLGKLERVEDSLFAAQTKRQERETKAGAKPSAKDEADLAKLAAEVAEIEKQKAELDEALAKLVAPPLHPKFRAVLGG